MNPSPITVAIVLAQQFPLISLSACLESLRIANRELGFTSFKWQFLTPDNAPVVSTSGISVNPDTSLEQVDRSPVVIVLSSYRPSDACTPALIRWLRQQHRQGATMGCVDTSAYILAKAQILGKDKVSVHRETLLAYREMLSESAVLDKMSATSNRIISSAGGVATLDMMLGLIGRFQGQTLADRVASVLNYRRMPAETTAAETSPDGTVSRVEPRLARMIDIMQSNTETPLHIGLICELGQVPKATANRLFLKYFQLTPNRYYLQLRLTRAHWLLQNSSMSVGDVAMHVGF